VEVGYASKDIPQTLLPHLTQLVPFSGHNRQVRMGIDQTRQNIGVAQVDDLGVRLNGSQPIQGTDFLDTIPLDQHAASAQGFFIRAVD
jgi:hypothetical protein